MINFILGDALAELRKLPADYFHMVGTSPPYIGLRSYPIKPTIWGGDPGCAHEFADEMVTGELRRGAGMAALSERYRGGGKKAGTVGAIAARRGFCRACGAWRGHLGLEPTPNLYVDHIVMVCEEVRRVLRPDGTFWLNLGDSYHSPRMSGGVGQNSTINGQGSQEEFRAAQRMQRGGLSGNKGYAHAETEAPHRAAPIAGLKPKDLIGAPWMVAFALRAAGWYLRQDIIWHKPNPMPESTEDRCTKSHEHLFLLSKSETYYYDAVAIAEPAIYNAESGQLPAAKGSFGGSRADADNVQIEQPFRAIQETRNKRDVWTIATTPFPGAHFAVFPPDLIEPCILAGSSAHGCCRTCRTPWRRITAPSERYANALQGSYFDHPAADQSEFVEGHDGRNLADGMMGNRSANNQNKMRDEAGIVCKEVITLGWYPSCKCEGLPKLPKYPKRPRRAKVDNLAQDEDHLLDDIPPDPTHEAAMKAWRAACRLIDGERKVLCDAAAPIKVEPCEVLDPFGGSGTTALMATANGRDATLIEASPQYLKMAKDRVLGPLFAFDRAAE